ncbi:MAG: metal-sensitive transcriptional regulator [Myxococcota bacterium]
MLDAETKRKVEAALKRIGGQVAGIQRMVDEERYCVDVLHQIAAAEGALERVGRLILSAHIDTCVASALESGSPRAGRKKAQELKDVLARFGWRSG